MNTDFTRYGFKNEGNILKVLNPLKEPDDANLFIFIDGFSRLKELNKIFEAAENINKPIFFLVSGASGSGRSSVAKYILSHYRKYHKIDSTRFFVPDEIDINNDDLYVIRNWILYLYTDLEDKGIELSKDIVEELRGGLGNVARETFRPVLKRIMRRISKILSSQNPPSSYGICIEDVKNYQTIDAFIDITKSTNTIAIFTVHENEYDIINSINNNVKIELSHLDGQEAREVIDVLWKQTNLHKKPFDGAQVENAFGTKNRSIGNIITRFKQLLEIKLNIKKDSVWPENNNLSFTPHELKEYLRLLDRGERPNV